MKYPTIEEVESATHEQLAHWHRFLPSPGAAAVGASQKTFQELLTKQGSILDRIGDRFKEMGGMTPEISKRIGW